MGPRLFSRGYHRSGQSSSWRQDCFNGATTFQSWILCRSAPDPTSSMPASMGPRLFSRGYEAGAMRGDVDWPGFNGATTFQSWIWDGHLCGGPRISGFNGATTFQSWICDQLEAGHHHTGSASMGPRLFSRGYPDTADRAGIVLALQWGHDFSVVDIAKTARHLSAVSSGFNGATTFQSWI